jgi:hypothetical protein
LTRKQALPSPGLRGEGKKAKAIRFLSPNSGAQKSESEKGAMEAQLDGRDMFLFRSM